MNFSLYAPSSPILKRYMHSIYFLDTAEREIQYRAYPHTANSLSLQKDTKASIKASHVSIYHSKGNYNGIIANCTLQPMSLTYRFIPDEICLNFNSFGLSSFAQADYSGNKSFIHFPNWDTFLEELFAATGRTNDIAEKISIIENFLLGQYQPIKDEELMFRAVSMLEDPESDGSIDEIAATLGVHGKYLYRCFKKYIGCSPAHYRMVSRFRRVISTRFQQGDQSRLVDLCYDNNYTDQSHFIKQFRRLTGDNPKRFFEDISLVDKNSIAWKFY